MRRLLLVLAAGGLALAAVVLAGTVLAPAPVQVETALVSRGTIETVVELSGTIAPATSRELAFGTAGTVAQVAVRAGDRVRAGQLLARLESDALEAQVAAARASLASAEARLEADRTGPSAIQRASARDPVVAAEAQLAAARQSASDVRAQNDQAVAAARDGLASAEARLAADQAAGAPPATLAADETAVASARSQLEAAELRRTAAVHQAEAAVTAARDGLVAARHAYQVRVAPTPAAVLRADEAALASARVALVQAERALELAALRAPIAGTVTEVGFSVGDRIGAAGATASTAGATGSAGGTVGIAPSGARIVLADLDRLEVAATASEIDVVGLSTGQVVTVTLDALPGVDLRGTICEVGLTGTADQGATEYPVRVCLEVGDPRLRVGMSASVSAVVARHENVLLVPSGAVRLVGGRHLVRRLEADGTIREVEVEVGLRSATRTEVVAGLADGDRVVVSRSPAAP